MHIQLTDQAAAQLSDTLSSGGIVKLLYDAEGCGCAVSGVASLHLLDKADSDDTAAVTSTDSVKIVYEQRHAVFFDEEMVLGYDPERRVYQLKSSGQIYHNRMVPTDRRQSHTAAQA